MKVHVIPFLDDNYAYIIEKPQEDEYTSQPVVLIDPADYEAVEARLVQLNLKPTMILTTVQSTNISTNIGTMLEGIWISCISTTISK